MKTQLKDTTESIVKRLLILVFMASLPLVIGCKGCSDDSAKKNDPEEKKAKENFEHLTPVTIPGFYPLDPEEKEKLEEEAKGDEKKLLEMRTSLDPAFRYNKTKLGHWVSIDFIAIANNFNAEGFLKTSSSKVNRPVLINGTNYFVETNRPFTLTKGEWKKLETSVYLPRKDRASKTNTISYVLDTGGSIPSLAPTMPVNLLEDYQFHMILLSKRADALKYLSFLDCVKLPAGETDIGAEPEFYSIVPTTPNNPIPLPNQSLNWTTIAYLIWDDIDPDDLSRSQQQAMLDWLHFGGQIIFSGPDCMDRLQSSFLADYLPGQFEESITLNKSDLEELNNNWSITSSKNPAEKRRLIVVDDAPLPAIRFRPHEDAEYIPFCSDLAIERRIGRGRVVATGFSLHNRQIRNWRSFSSFFHNALLRKPARRFVETRELNVLTFKFPSDRTSIYDPLTGSTLRFISRDLATNSIDAKTVHAEKTASDYENVDYATRAQLDGRGAFGERSEFILPGTGLNRNEDDVFHYGGYDSATQSGVAGWNDDSGIATAARETLKKAARITPPSASFVMKMLGLYLLILVPINWLIFRLIGKVEWAWIAAPIIAITGAFAVVRYASLDIGFVRSVTHVGVLELQGDYSRGHLTDYSALYTSLSTRYSVELDNLSGQSIPFANVPTDKFRRGDASAKRVELSRTTTTDLKNYLVRSNSTGLLHSEMILDVGGGIRLSGDDSLFSVENDSLINIEDAGVVRRNGKGDLEFGWIGKLEAGSQANIEFTELEGSVEDGWAKVDALVGDAKTVDGIWKDQSFSDRISVSIDELASVPALKPNWPALNEKLTAKMKAQSRDTVSKSMLAAALASVDGSGASLASVFDCVASNLKVGRNEVRLIGRTDQQLDQSRYQPGATQAKHNLLVVVHLRHASLPICEKDKNAVSDFDRGRSNIDQEEDEEEDFLVPTSVE